MKKQKGRAGFHQIEYMFWEQIKHTARIIERRMYKFGGIWLLVCSQTRASNLQTAS